MSLKENLKMLRKAKGLKQAELSKIIDKQPLTISRYENGQISPPLPILEKLSELYGISTRNMMLDVQYENKKKYSLEEIKELLQEKPTKKSHQINNNMAIRMSLSIFKAAMEDFKEMGYTEKDFSESENISIKFFKKFYDFYINNDFNLSEKEAAEILKDLENYFTFLIDKNIKKINLK